MSDEQKEKKAKKVVGVGGPMKEMNETLRRVEGLLTSIEANLKRPLDVPSLSVIDKSEELQTRVADVPSPIQRKEPQFPIPYEYQELKNTLLNKHFEIDIEYIPDQVAMSFSILVPKKYSNAGEMHWGTYKEDRRSKVIPNALGANGVRQWMEQVYNNFNETTKSLITYDRAQL